MSDTIYIPVKLENIQNCEGCIALECNSVQRHKAGTMWVYECKAGFKIDNNARLFAPPRPEDCIRVSCV